ncbi:MAG TPA: DegT/DnrJ/EryC1/StrS family aminotransferase [Terriglobales bacterium]|nr:DegT/DnrJ/EryC1/StrS family aminotransferase [Terriglobales bacterium]
MQVPLSKPDVSEREIERVCDVLRSSRLSLGPAVPEFEQRFACYVGTGYAVAVNSGTSALHLITRALGIGAGDEVITTSFSFVASTNCFLYEGAAPVFVDIDPATLNLDPRAVRTFLTTQCEINGNAVIHRRTGRRVKAIVPVHVFGVPCDMQPILELAREFHLRVIEDSCEAIGATYHGRNAGTFGDAAAFAFYPNKQMTTGEGGMIVTSDERIAVECRSMRNQGRDASCEWLQHARLGYNYRLSDIHAALGIGQLERITELLASRARVAAAYNRRLAGHGQIRLPQHPAGVTPSWFVYVIRIKGTQAARDQVISILRSQGVGCQAYFPAIHHQPYVKKFIPAGLALPNTEAAAATCVALPFFSQISEAEIAYVCDQLKVALDQVLNGPVAAVA